MREQTFKGRMLVCDMDGTLLNSKSRISEENKRALRRFTEGGGLFTVATGRMYRAVEPYLKDLPLNIPAIVYNGAAIYDFTARKMLWQDCLPGYMEDVAQRLLDRFPQAGFEVFRSDGSLFLLRQNYITDGHMKREGFFPRYAEKLDEVSRPWFKLLVAWDPEKLIEVEDFLKDIKEPFTAVYSESYFLELLNQGVSKGNALKQLASMCDFPIQNIVAMGDNLNDVELLRAAGTGIATDNAHEALKEASDLCCCHHDNNAVAEVVDWIEDGTVRFLAAV